MLTKEILSLLGRKGKNLAGQYFRDNVQAAMNSPNKDWFSTGYNNLVLRSVNHGLAGIGSEVRLESISSNTANAVGNRIDP